MIGEGRDVQLLQVGGDFLHVIAGRGVDDAGLAAARAHQVEEALLRLRAFALGGEHEHDDFESFVVSVPEISDPADLLARLQAVAETHDVLRIKGFVAVEQGRAPVVIHCVRHVVHFPEHLADWPDERRTSYLVFIVRDLEPDQVLRSFLAFTGRPGVRMAGGPVPAPHHHPTEAAIA